jgi:dihydroorotase/N-acyl-D-amino-acid deacylase
MMMLRCLSLALALAGVLAAQSFDVLIRNGHVIDGSGSPWYSADVGIRAGRIAAIGRLANATGAKTIDAHGQVVAPGFIDMLGQSELTILVNPHLPSKIYQGITTEITGEGNSAAPLNDAIRKADRAAYQHYGIPRIGAPSANTSHASKSRALGSMLPITSARPRSVAWCSVMPTALPRRPRWSR